MESALRLSLATQRSSTEVVEPNEYTSNGHDHPDDNQRRNDKEKHRCEHVERQRQHALSIRAYAEKRTAAFSDAEFVFL